MARGRFNFQIDDSYTMDEEASDNDDDPSSSSSSSIPPPDSAAKIISGTPDESSSSQLARHVEEKKSDNSIGNESAEDEQHHDVQEELVDAAEATLLSAASILSQQSSNHLRDDHYSMYQPSSQKSIKGRRSSTDDDTNDSDHQQEPPSQSTMAMVKLRVWDPAAPSRQFHVITASTVMLGDNQESYNAISSYSDGNPDSNTVSSSLSKYYERTQTQRRLSMVKEERLNSFGSICDGEDNVLAEPTTTSSSDNNNHLDAANAALLSDDRRQQFHQLERQKTVKANNLSQFHQLVDEQDDITGDDDDTTETNKNRLEIGKLVGIHLIKNNNTTLLSTNNSTTAARNNNKQQSEWKVGNSIRVLHNVNLIPSHTAGLEQLLYKIEHNDPSIRELILDGITTNNSNTSTPLSYKHLEILIEAIGQNTSIQKCSLRHSQITNQIASMLALALVDNTTISILSLRGNELTSVAVKNFYSVLSSNNRTLKVLDISDNPGIEEDVCEAFETFMEQRAVKRMLMLKAEKAKRIMRGLPLLNEMLEEEEDDGIIGSGGGRGKGRRNGSGGGCCVTVVCHPDVIDGTFHSNQSNNETVQQQQFHPSNSVQNSYESVLQSEGPESSGSSPGEERVYYNSVFSDITGIGGKNVDSPPPQDLHPPQAIRSDINPQHQQHPQERMPSPQRSIGHFDPRYSTASSQLSSNDSSTSRSGNESLDHRQRQQLATVNSVRSSSRNLQHSTTSNVSQHSTSTRSGDNKATERALRRQLADQGKTIGAHAIADVAPDRQEVRGRRARVRRTESQRRARLSEIDGGGTAATRQAPAAAARQAPIDEEEEGGGMVDADIEGMDEYEYRNMSKYHKFFYRIGLDGEEKKTDRMICLTFCICILVLIAAVILYVTLDS